MPRLFYFLGTEQFYPEEIVAHSVLAEKAGFDGVMVSEHFHPWVDDVGTASYTWSTLGAIANATERVSIVTGVTTPLFRFHPALVAQAAATIQRISNGRFELGVGTGENINEGPLGYSFPKYKERSARMKEALEVIQKLLNGEKVTYDGEYYKTDSAKLYSNAEKSIPIFLAAGGPKSAALAGEYTDGVITSVKNVSETFEKVITPAQGKNKNLHVMATRWTICADDDESMWQALKPWRGLRAPSRLSAVDPETLRTEADAMDRTEILGKYTRVSDAASYVAAYTELITDVHADTIVIQTTSNQDQKDLIAMLGADVLPELRKID